MNSWLRSALERTAAAALAAAVCVGCGRSDGREELEKGRRAYAERNLEKADRLFAESRVLDPSNVDACVESVRAKIALGDIPAAQEAARRAAELSPDDADVMEAGAQAAYHAKDYEAAKRGFRRLAEGKFDAATRARGWVGLGVVHVAENAKDEALIAFLRAMALDRRSASARYNLGHLYWHAFAYLDAAREQFDAYTRLDKSADQTRVQKVLRDVIPGLQEELRRQATKVPGAGRRDAAASQKALAAANALAKKDARKARAEYERAAALDTLSFPAALALAKAWARDTSASGQRKAFECYKKACDLRPDDVKTCIAAGELAARLGQHASAVAYYMRAMAANPRDLTAIDGLIRALRRTGGDGARLATLYQRYRSFIAPPARSR